MAVITSDIKRADLLIGGEWREASNGKRFPVIDPSLGEVTAEVAEAGEADVDLAVAAAWESFRDQRWHGIDPIERGRILHEAGRLIRQQIWEIAHLMSRENGMPINVALNVEIPMVIDCFDYFASLTSQVKGETLPFSLTGAPPEHFVFTLKEPIGVAGLITPWNFPLLMPAWKIAPALAAGCSMVLKPAPQTPLTALKLAEICEQAGVPPGVVNVVPGGDEAGRALVAHPQVPKIAFTGETATGRHILASAAPHIKRVTLELGGKSPNIVFNDANLEEAAQSALFGIFFNSGQVCQAGSRIFVQRESYKPFLEALASMARKLKVGQGTDPTTDLGPVISEEQLNKIESYIERGKRDGAELLVGGNRPAHLPKGYFIEPTIFAGVRPDMAIAREEIFGPVAAVLPFSDEEDVIRQANDTIYGLAAAVWTRDIKRGLRLVKRIQSGTVWVNTYQVLTPTAPFGGYKQSGLGRELGDRSLEAYLETKTVIVDLNEKPMMFF